MGKVAWRKIFFYFFFPSFRCMSIVTFFFFLALDPGWREGNNNNNIYKEELSCSLFLLPVLKISVSFPPLQAFDNIIILSVYSPYISLYPI